ncbi:NAD(P)-dependent alcohol dehydrogenase [Salinispora arenicola]|uniref:alcohol dehydrogenase (NADP(+)) n=1 Tax=Salinispora arenicola TaxID=168697 RepID=A0A542XTI1_SALAC|nr:NAD(P)-dependent alcohol dehydrogenase [Salinispora arenicola]TQL39104.1 putative zinc-type alcohol dehydrogenase-like protein [Salinispora arenicola]GIM87999.1 alcohol dehydrogenase [Salinispora arenicola]
MYTTNAFAAPAAGAPLRAMTIQRREVGPRDVLIDISYCGICHTDIHTVRGEWGERSYPIVPGHEIIGVVAAIGTDVTKHQVGDVVGVGCMVNSCRECVSCQAGEEQYCAKGVIGTYAAVDVDGTATQGGYASRIVVTEDFVLRIPDGLDRAAAAPLVCAGITMYSPLRRWGAGPGKKVAIIGLGGVGHVGVKLAAAMGAEVIVLSQTLKKREDGLKLGATGYFATNDPDTFTTLAGTFDLILNTVSARVDMDAYLSLLGTGGTLVSVGIPPEQLALHTFSLVMGRKTLAGSLFGGIAETQEMLDFCAQHNITADIETIPAREINKAYERVLASDVRYRFVIDVATLS